MSMSVRSSQRRNSVVRHTIRPRRPHAGQRQPFLYGLTARCNSLLRFLNQKSVIFIPFRRSILYSNFRLLTGFSSFLLTSIYRGNEACVFKLIQDGLRVDKA